MAGVDPRTLQTLGNWRSLSMVERYSHLSPDHLRAAVEKLVGANTQATPVPAPAAGPQLAAGMELDRNLTVLHDGASRVS
jgi:hypothetical protein